jgi:hypothetical protein
VASAEAPAMYYLTLFDAYHRFIYFDIGFNGRAGDASFWACSNLLFAIEEDFLDLPPSKVLPGTMVNGIAIQNDRRTVRQHCKTIRHKHTVV